MLPTVGEPLGVVVGLGADATALVVVVEFGAGADAATALVAAGGEAAVVAATSGAGAAVASVALAATVCTDGDGAPPVVATVASSGCGPFGDAFRRAVPTSTGMSARSPAASTVIHASPSPTHSTFTVEAALLVTRATTTCSLVERASGA